LLHWRDVLGERNFADWFEAEYGQFPWLNWHVTASGIPGFTANNNSNKTFNRDAKRGEKIKSNSVVGVYMTETMSRCLRNWSMELGTQIRPIVNSIEGFITQ
jgi:hypothetical protein